MQTRRKREQRVLFFLKRLEEAMELVNKTNKEDPLVSKFEVVQNQLRSIKDLLSKINEWDDTLTKQFTSLEKEFADGILEKRDKVNEFNEKLQTINKIVGSIKELISFVVEVERKAITINSNSSPQSSSQESQDRITSKEWSEMRVEKEVLSSLKKMPPDLQLSFDNLKSFQSKLCLLCFSIFPEKCVIKKRPLIYWWIGEGLVTKTNNKTADEVGENIFQELIKEGLINPVYKNHSPIVDSCTVHPWIRRMLIWVAKDAKFFPFDDPTGTLCNDSRRAFLMLAEEDSNYGSKEQQTLMSVFNVSTKYISFKPDWLSKFKKLEVLQLGRWQHSAKHHIEVGKNELLNGLGVQKRLRYLSLQGISRITSLPDSINGLISLEILDLRACHNLEKLPSDISELINLTHLDISECYLLESMPKGLENLSALQVLKGFVVGNSIKTPNCKLSDLAKLKNLRKLSIYIRSEAVIQVKLKDMVALRILTISWDLKVPNVRDENKEFSFPSNLKKLDLRCVPYKTTSNWLKPRELTSLEKLYIRGGKLDSLDHTNTDDKWNVKFLRLKYLRNLGVGKEELKTKFPDIVYLEKFRCRKISDDKFDDILYGKKMEEEEAMAFKL
uniref:Disease resistance RPP13-like protein 4 n=1 Tax=Davidia involucrata TaxID=16924 RepID=A0A5B7BZM0_DAVIN